MLGIGAIPLALGTLGLLSLALRLLAHGAIEGSVLRLALLVRVVANVLVLWRQARDGRLGRFLVQPAGPNSCFASSGVNTRSVITRPPSPAPGSNHATPRFAGRSAAGGLNRDPFATRSDP